MSKIDSIQNVVRHGLCVSCGACISAVPSGGLELRLDAKGGGYVPVLPKSRRVSGKGAEFAVCPGPGFPIDHMAKKLYGEATCHSFELGYYRRSVAVHSTDDRILKNASSGGVMTGIANYLLEKKLVDGVTASRFIYGEGGPRTEPFIAKTLDELISAQGSKYCPTSTNLLVSTCKESGGRYLFIGMPCQVGALRLAMQEDPSLAKIFPYTMANFCGGYRDFNSLNSFISERGIDPAEVEYFRFREGRPPGSLLCRTRSGEGFSLSYLDYRPREAKHKRCTYCVDATGELADFACGDAWVDSFLQDEYPWSILLARSELAGKILNEMTETGLLVTAPIEADEIVKSQSTNIESKKVRQYKRMRISCMFGIKMPAWDIDLPKSGSYVYELRVLLGKSRLGPFTSSAIRVLRIILRRPY